TEAGPDDAALDAAIDAVWEFASQIKDETGEQRAARLTPLFAPGAQAPTMTPPQVAPDGIALVQSVPSTIAWTSPFDTGDPARIGMLVALQATSTGSYDGGLWNDTTTNVWRVVLTAQDGTWAPTVVYPDGQPEPGAQS
ncbi:MAG: hypothetical protein REI45_11005, partial [Propionicimonas sp.]|nr:hypothetical protein [Propionicimonas sp.]